MIHVVIDYQSDHFGLMYSDSYQVDLVPDADAIPQLCLLIDMHSHRFIKQALLTFACGL
jgi:hypothetical protein